MPQHLILDDGSFYAKNAARNAEALIKARYAAIIGGPEARQAFDGLLGDVLSEARDDEGDDVLVWAHLVWALVTAAADRCAPLIDVTGME